MNVNLGEMKDFEFALLPAGDYLAECTSCSYGISKTSGNPMWTFKFNIIEGDFENSKLNAFVVNDPEKGAPMLRPMLRGFADELGIDLSVRNINFDGPEVNRKICIIKVTQRPDNRDKSKMQNGISSTMPVSAFEESEDDLPF